jgi:hypothetical protein
MKQGQEGMRYKNTHLVEPKEEKEEPTPKEKEEPTPKEEEEINIKHVKNFNNIIY